MRHLALLTLLLISGVSNAALVTLTFEGNLDTVTAATTVTAGTAAPANVNGPAAYTGFVEYDSASGAVVNGELTFASGYTINNHHPFVPSLARVERSWGAVTYGLSGTMIAGGDVLALLIGNELVPGVNIAHDADVLGVRSSSLAPAIFGEIPTCTAELAERQSYNCSHAPGEEILGLDSLLLQVSTVDNIHTLDMDEVIDHCGGACSTEWWHMSGGGTAMVTSVPVPAAVWLFGSALAALGWMRRRPRAFGQAKS